MRCVFAAAAVSAVTAVCAAAFLAHAQELSLTIGDLDAPGFSARSISLTVSGASFQELTVDIGRVSIAGRDWRKVRLTCPDFVAAGERITCSHGLLHLDDKIPVSFAYTTGRGDLTVELKPASDETWQIAGRIGGAKTTLQVKLDRAQLMRLSSWSPPSVPRITAGRASGTIDMQGAAVTARLQVDDVAFADASGLHAGDKIGGTLNVEAAQKGTEWRWTLSADWGRGEVFWQPFFLSATGQRLRVQGASSAATTSFRDGVLELQGVGAVDFNAQFNHSKGELETLQVRSGRLRVPTLYEQVLKPLLQQTSLSDLRTQGEATVALTVAGGTIAAVDLELYDVSLEDQQQRRFALFGATGRIPWHRDEASAGEIVFKGAEFLKVPLGGVRIPFRVRSNGVAVTSIRVPILDGALKLRDFAAGTTDEGWRWRFSGELEAISMAQLTRATGMPEMHGSLSGVVPEVRYRRQTLAMDGALAISVFDGVVRASNVELIEPFGRAPRLHADIDMKALDLELLTRTFDFGTITGRLDARVSGLELVGWQPVRFDARLESSAGNYPKRISQRAVQNISALGGAGAAVAIQRSFLRFFDQFGYEKIGLSCRLNNAVCEMDGIERAPQGYVIVKGGGIPAISVIGYNRYVSWRELVDRLKRITQENVKPIVK
ncbi:MAG: hypothetical protein ACXWCY_05965 [Burkholderiales bacterium]